MIINSGSNIGDFIKAVVSSSSGLSDITLLYSGDDSFQDLTDFAEYDFDFRLDPVKFNSRSVFELTSAKEISDELFPILGKLKDIYFPTLVSDSETSRYFSSIHQNDRMYYLFDVPPGYDMLSLYSDQGLVLTAQMEADKDEVDCGNIVLLLVSSGSDLSNGSELGLNISVRSWKHSPQPARNKLEYSLRNDELMSIPVTSIPVIEDDIDRRNGIILGFHRPENLPPILSRKLSYIESTSSWSSAVSYKAGEECSWDNSDWISLVDLNKGNIPGTSSTWVMKSVVSLESMYSTVIHLVGDATYDNGKEFYTILSSDDTITLTLFPKPGNSLETVDLGYEYGIVGGGSGASLGPYSEIDGSRVLTISGEFLSQVKSSGILYVEAEEVPAEMLKLIPKIFDPVSGEYKTFALINKDSRPHLQVQKSSFTWCDDYFTIDSKYTSGYLRFGTTDSGVGYIECQAGSVIKYVLEQDADPNHITSLYLPGTTSDQGTSSEEYTGSKPRDGKLLISTNMLSDDKEVEFDTIVNDLVLNVVTDNMDIAPVVVSKYYDSYPYKSSNQEIKFYFSENEPENGYEIRLDGYFSGWSRGDGVRSLRWRWTDTEFNFLDVSRSFGPGFDPLDPDSVAKSFVKLSKSDGIYTLSITGEITYNIDIQL